MLLFTPPAVISAFSDPVEIRFSPTSAPAASLRPVEAVSTIVTALAPIDQALTCPP